jgi:hypothetical protein
MINNHAISIKVWRLLTLESIEKVRALSHEIKLLLTVMVALATLIVGGSSSTGI